MLNGVIRLAKSFAMVFNFESALSNPDSSVLKSHTATWRNLPCAKACKVFTSV